MPKFIDITGKKFSRLTAIKYVGTSLWLFECDCGADLISRSSHVKAGHTKSCGCYNKEFNKPSRFRHGHTKTKCSPEYYSWISMRTRCLNPKSNNYKYYGALGISVCPEWNSFEQFLLDMGPRPIGTSIHRLDNGKGYSKDNCCWADSTTQSQHRKKNPCKGENNPIAKLSNSSVKQIKNSAGKVSGTELAKQFNVHPATISKILLGKTWKHICVNAA